MADITYTGSLVINKGGAYFTTQTTGTNFTDTIVAASPQSAGQTYTLTNSYVAIDKGSVATIGLFAIRNLSASSSDVCSVSTDGGTTEAFVVPAGGFTAIKRNSSTALKLKWSAGAAHQVQYWLADA